LSQEQFSLLIETQHAILQELEFIRQNTRAAVLGEAADAGWSIMQYGLNFSNTLPGFPTSSLPPGGIVNTINEETSKGQFIFVSLVSNNPYVSLGLETRAPNNSWNTTIQLSPYILYQANLNQTNDRLPFLARYDTLSGVYAVEWLPGFGLGFHHGVKGVLTNPATNPATNTANTAATIFELIIIRKLYTQAQVVNGVAQEH
jgi:hypothetical protein